MTQLTKGDSSLPSRYFREQSAFALHLRLFRSKFPWGLSSWKWILIPSQDKTALQCFLQDFHRFACRLKVQCHFLRDLCSYSLRILIGWMAWTHFDSLPLTSRFHCLVHSPQAWDLPFQSFVVQRKREYGCLLTVETWLHWWVDLGELAKVCVCQIEPHHWVYRWQAYRN